MKKLIFLGCVIIPIIFASCKDDLTADHSNIYDPLSERYTPTGPAYYGYNINDDYIEFMWLDKSEGEQGFIISKAELFGNYIIIDTVSIPIERPTVSYDYSYRDSFHVEPGRYYYYNISPYKGNHIAQGVNFTSKSTFNPPQFYTVFTISSTTARLVWNKAASSFPTKYYIERKTYPEPNSEYKVIDTLDSYLTTYDDNYLDTNKTYVYRAISFSKYYMSEYSIEMYIAYNGRWYKRTAPF